MKSLVIVPTFNEAATLQLAVNRAARALSGHGSGDVLVVDDGSPDGTGVLAARLADEQPCIHVLHRTGKQGLGSAYRAGFAWGLERGYDVLCEMDADLSHDPADLPRLLDALSHADVAIGSRYVRAGRVVDWPKRRLALSRGGNAYVRLLTGVPLRDATAGFRAYRAQVLRATDVTTLESDGYAFQIEVALRAWRAGFRLVEVPIVFTERRTGASKMSHEIVSEALWRTAVWGLRGPRRPQARSGAQWARPSAPQASARDPERVLDLTRTPRQHHTISLRSAK